jgi:hypothetical protein
MSIQCDEVLFAQDYARLHKYHFISATTQADATLDNMWNKVGWLLKAYHVSACSRGLLQ